MSHRRSRLLLAGTAALALMVAACGGDDADDDTGTGAASSPTPTAAASTPTAAPTERASGSGDGGLGGVTGLPSQECRDAALAISGVFMSMVPGLGISDEDLEQYREALSTAQANAPAGIRDAIETFTDAWSQVRDAIEASDWDPNSGQAPPSSVLQALQGMESPELEAASDEVTAWLEDNCPTE